MSDITSIRPRATLTFCVRSGHGDVVAQAFLLEGLGDAPSTHPLGQSQGHAPRR